MKDNQAVIILSALVSIVTLSELIYCVFKKNGLYSFGETYLNFNTLVLAHVVNFASLPPLYAIYDWLYRTYAIFHFKNTWWTGALCYVGCDLAFYWFHRAAHRVHFFWAAHIPHHSSTELNLVTAFRASLTQRAISFFFYAPLCLLGFNADTVLTFIGINLVVLVLPHTQLLPHYPRWLSRWMITPADHHLHHAKNRVYWDKNYGGTLVIWDKLFGTYMEKGAEPIEIGVSTPPRSWNPYTVNFHRFEVMFRSFFATRGLRNRFKVLFAPPDFRPSDLGLESEDPHVAEAWERRQLQPIPALRKFYLSVQMLLLFVSLVPIVNAKSQFTLEQTLVWSAAVFFHAHTLALILEARRGAWRWETLRVILLSVLAMNLPLDRELPHLSSILILSSLGMLVFEAAGRRIRPLAIAAKESSLN